MEGVKVGKRKKQWRWWENNSLSRPGHCDGTGGQIDGGESGKRDQAVTRIKEGNRRK